MGTFCNVSIFFYESEYNADCVMYVEKGGSGLASPSVSTVNSVQYQVV